tara:strand:- start:37 stop:387 length:351 start_codon:yes stop_codon:yes gene_type:complete
LCVEIGEARSVFFYFNGRDGLHQTGYAVCCLVKTRGLRKVSKQRLTRPVIIQRNPAMFCLLQKTLYSFPCQQKGITRHEQNVVLKLVSNPWNQAMKAVNVRRVNHHFPSKRLLTFR